MGRPVWYTPSMADRAAATVCRPNENTISESTNSLRLQLSLLFTYCHHERRLHQQDHPEDPERRMVAGEGQGEGCRRG